MDRFYKSVTITPMIKNTEHFKEMLQNEVAKIEKELGNLYVQADREKP